MSMSALSLTLYTVHNQRGGVFVRDYGFVRLIKSNFKRKRSNEIHERETEKMKRLSLKRQNRFGGVLCCVCALLSETQPIDFVYIRREVTTKFFFGLLFLLQSIPRIAPTNDDKNMRLFFCCFRFLSMENLQLF